MSAENFDADAWVTSRFQVKNDTGGRGFDRGVRIIDCPFCHDTSGRAWVNVAIKRTGCFRLSCSNNGGMGFVEFVRQVEGFVTWTEARMFLRYEFPSIYDSPAVPLPPSDYDDWCALPQEFVPFSKRPDGVSKVEALSFCQRQWGGVSREILEKAGMGYCISGRYAYRVIIPIYLRGVLVAFQARTYRNAEPKYLTSSFGARTDARAECGRPAEALLYGLDELKEGGVGILVEGVGDVLQWRSRNTSITAVGQLGTAFTAEKAALIAMKRPAKIIQGLDSDAVQIGIQVESLLDAWGIQVESGSWQGGKDAGTGAQLIVEPSTLSTRVARLLKRP